MDKNTFSAIYSSFLTVIAALTKANNAYTFNFAVKTIKNSLDPLQPKDSELFVFVRKTLCNSSFF